MVAAIILGLHILGALYAFISRMRKDGWSEGILALAFVGVIFSVGWTIMTMLTSLFLEPEGFAKWLNRDAVTLALLTIAEGVFYYFFLRGEAPQKD